MPDCNPDNDTQLKRERTTMNAFLQTENVEAIFEKSRRRQDELYFNSMCLFRVLLNRDWRKTPFFLRNLRRASPSEHAARNSRTDPLEQVPYLEP